MRPTFLALGVIFLASACSSKSTSGAPTTTTPEAGTSDDAATDASTNESDAAIGDSSTVEPVDAHTNVPFDACFGSRVPFELAYETAYVDVTVGSSNGDFLIDFATTGSSIDTTAFPSPGVTTSNCSGGKCTVADFSFFSTPGDVTLITQNYSSLGASPRQAGIIATDILSEHVITLDYTNSYIYGTSSSSFCTDDALKSAGFVALTTAGYYENDISMLNAANAVDTTKTSGYVPNVPTVPVQIGGAKAEAQLDTGFDDSVHPLTVNINEPFLDLINQDDATALVRDMSLDTDLSTCTGASENVLGYRLAAGHSLEFIATDGSTVRTYTNPPIFLKRTPTSAHACGGIGTWTAPGAQVGGTFFVDVGKIVFDPYSARVWMPKN